MRQRPSETTKSSGDNFEIQISKCFLPPDKGSEFKIWPFRRLKLRLHHRQLVIPSGFVSWFQAGGDDARAARDNAGRRFSSLYTTKLPGPLKHSPATPLETSDVRERHTMVNVWEFRAVRVDARRILIGLLASI